LYRRALAAARGHEQGFGELGVAEKRTVKSEHRTLEHVGCPEERGADVVQFRFEERI
jgi:hypothetical protein